MDYKHEQNRIYVKDKHLLLAEVTFPALDDLTVEIDHVFVDPSLRGQGVAAKIMQETYAFIKSSGLKAVAKCPYAIAWFKRNPDRHDILAKNV